MPFSHFCEAVREDYSHPQSSTRTPRYISRGKLSYLPRSRFDQYCPMWMEGFAVACQLALTRRTPRIGFANLAPHIV